MSAKINKYLFKHFNINFIIYFQMYINKTKSIKHYCKIINLN